MANKSVLVDLDMASVSKVINLPIAENNGEAVRYNEFASLDTNKDNLVTLSGVAENAAHLSTFTGSTISDNVTIKAALQSLETEVEKTSLTIASESQSVLSITGNELKMESLAITDVTVDTQKTSLAAWITANATHTLAMGDVLILTAGESQEQTWICSTNSPSQSPASAGDFTRLQTDIAAQDVRAFLAGTADEIDYNSTTGVFSFNANAVENLLPTSHTWVGLGTPSDVQDFMQKADQEFKNIQGGTSLEVGSVTTAKLDADAVTNSKLADDAVQTENILDANVTTAKIAALNVTTAKIAADAIVNSKLADDAVETANILDANVTLAKMASDSVNGSKIADSSIDSEHYVDASLLFEHICPTCYTTDLSSSAGNDELARADAVKSYVDGRTYVRKLFSAQSLTADTEATLNHALSNKYVSVQVFNDTDDKEVDFELTLTDANNCKVEVAVSGTYSVLVIG